MGYKDPVKKKEYQDAYYQRNKEKLKLQTKEYIIKNREIVAIRKKVYYQKNKHRIIRKPKDPIEQKEYDLQRNYGMSVRVYDEMLKKQNGVCGICRNKCKSGRNLAVDHDHKTKKVRGLLCGGCNIGLGTFKDNIELLQNAIRYLEEYYQSFKE